jgi:L-glutamine-phosphate cytidylyltransferase
MKAIILSAGQGRRLLPLTADKPKSAIAVLDRSVLEWQLNEIAQCAVDEVVVVTGFAADVIDDIARRQTEVRVRTLYNPFFAQCDNLGTCWIARHEMQGDFIIVNGDTLFEAAIMQRLLATDVGAAVTLVTDSKPAYDDDDMKVVVLRRVGKKLDTAAVNGESIGMMCFRREGGARFTAQLDHMMRYGTGLKQWYLAAVDKLADDGLVATCPIDGLSWCEIDDRADLERAERVVSAWYPARGVSAAG